MKKIKDEQMSRELLMELLYLSSDFCFILNTELKPFEVLCDDEALYEVIRDPFSAIEPEQDFHDFIQAVYLEEKKKLKRQFYINVKTEEILVECTASKKNNHIIVIGTKIESYMRYHKELFHHVPLPVLLLSKTGEIVDYNDQLLNIHSQLGIPIKNVATLENGTSVHEIFEAYRSIYCNLLKTKEEVYHEFTVDDFRMSLHGLFDGDHLVIMLKDESYQRKFEQLLTYQQQMQAVSQIAAGVAHELRNPLSVIKGFIQLSKLSNSLDKYYDTIYSEIDQMNKIIEDFLSISRKKIDKRYVQPGEIMGSLLMIFRSECILHNVEFVCELDEVPHYLYVNEQMIKQVLINILRNSIEAYEGQKNNRVFKVISYRDGDLFKILFEDYGPGIQPDVMKKIEQPFYTTKEKGTGIGIPLGIQIMEEHKGKFEIDSEYGKGTTISITLPLIKKDKNGEKFIEG